MINNKSLSLKNDIIFKAFFSRKGNEEFLIDFLEALLQIEIKKIKIKDEVSLEQLSENEKGGRLDLQAELNNGIIVNIELQIRDEKNIKERTMFYSSKVMARQIRRGADYKKIKQVIMINILDYEMFEFNEYVSETNIVLEKHREYEVLKGIKWYFIELPKFRKQKVDLKDKLNGWLAFIDNYDEEVVEMAVNNNTVLKKARYELGYLTGDKARKRLEELREKWEMDRISSINYAKEEGIKEGKIEGKREKSIEIAKELKNMNMTIEEISKITKLTVEEINYL